MRAFFDTSSLVKLYDPTEADSSRLVTAAASLSAIVLAELSRVEFVSALQRKARRADITPEQAQTVTHFFQGGSGSYEWIALFTPMLQSAATLLEKHTALALRSLDAIQLAAALAAGPLDAFFSHDERLRQAALAEGLPVR
jgi:predicted nucleic acid-binding protein